MLARPRSPLGRHRARTLALASAAAAIVACGGGSVTPTPALDPDASTDASSNDAFPDASTDALDLVDGTAGSQTGVISLVSNAFGGSVVASFLTVVSPGSSGCTATPLLSCTYLECDTVPQPPTTTASSAGPIRITGGANEISLPANADGSYDALDSSAALWHVGDRIVVSAPGATIGAFSLSALAPSPVAISDPVFDPTGATTFPRTAPLDFAWSGGNDGDTVTMVIAYAIGPPSKQIVCNAAASAGQLRVTPAMLSMMPGGMMGFTATTSTTADAPAGSWHVHLSLSSDATLAGGTDARTSFLLE